MSTADANIVKLADLPKPQDFRLSEREREEILHEISQYPEARAASIEALKIAQRRLGWVPDAAIAEVAPLLGISTAELDGVATFYNLIYRQPVGRHVITICDSVACYLTGYEATRDALIQALGIQPGQTTADGRFTLLPICCLGACDHGPVLMIGEDTHLDVTPATVPAMLEAYQ